MIGNAPDRYAKTKEHGRFSLAVVGEAPGAEEEDSGLLFSGSAGELLWRELGELGLDRSLFFVTNVVKCRPEDNATPTKPQIKTCVGSFLWPELNLLKPRFGLLLGNSALYGVTGKSGITKKVGQVYDVEGTQWVASIHPAAVLRNPRMLASFRMALLTFKRLIRNDQGQPSTEAEVVNDKHALAKLIEDLKVAKVGAIDIESDGDLPGHGNFKGGGLAWWDDTWMMTHLNITLRTGHAYVIPLWAKGSRWKDPQKVLNVLRPYIEAVPHWIMHNGKYDEKCLEQVGISVRCSTDTMGLLYAEDENNQKDLGFAATLYLAAPEYKEMVDKSDMRNAPLKLAVEYGGRDTDYTYRLGRMLRRRMKRSLELRLYDKLLHPATAVLTDVELRGLPINRRKFAKRAIEIEAEIETAEEHIFDVAGMTFNVNSTKQLGQVLFEVLELPVVEYTPSGKPSTAESTLVRLRDLDDTGVIDAIFDYRQWAGYRSRYVESWRYFMDTAGRLHPGFKPYHTVTGRLSASDPNVQQIPRDPKIRGLVGGRRGWSVVEVDYSQVELRLAAHYSQDSTLLRIFNTGRDPHTETAMAVTGLSEPEITKEIRKKAKAVNFGFLYGMGAPKFREYAKTSYGVDVTEGEAQTVRKAFFQTFKGLPAWHERQRSVAKRRGWVVSTIGRKRRLHDVKSSTAAVRHEAERQAINSPVQSLASDMMLMAMILLAGKLDPDEARIISTVHDAILFEVRDDVIDKWVPVIIEAMKEGVLDYMEREFDSYLTVPIEVEAKYGRHWAEGDQVFAL